jgi:hypothetical protein
MAVPQVVETPTMPLWDRNLSVLRRCGILGHSRIQTTLDLYTDEDLDEMIAAQEKFRNALGFESGSVQ